MFRILQEVLQFQDYNLPFMSAYNIFLLKDKEQRLPKHLNELLIDALARKMYEQAQFLISLGADINYKFNPNYTLPVYLEYRPQAVEFLQANGYDFHTVDMYGMNALDSAVRKFVSLKEFIGARCIERIRLILNYIDWSRFSIRVIGGIEYGDQHPDPGHYNNHHWRRERIEQLLALGMPYNLDACCNRTHPDCPTCRKLKDTRLGRYLILK
jgi:hypothetical protein